MGKELKKIIEEYGLEALNYPDDLGKTMRERGASEKDVYAVMLILKCCPSVAGLLTQGEVSDVEANALIRSAVLQTGLSVGTVRQTLGELMRACGIKAGWAPHLAIRDSFVSPKVRPAAEERKDISELLGQMEKKEPDSAALSDLSNLAEAGNVQAAYTLGMHFKQADDKNGTEDGLRYFEMAARMGYGPAHGAVADYKIRRKHKQMWDIANHFQNPVALAGTDGRQWAPLAQKLLEYRQENRKRIQSTLWMQVIMLVLSLILVGVSTMDPGFWGRFAVIVQALGLMWTLVCLLLKNYHSVKPACCGMMLSWLVLILVVF